MRRHLLPRLGDFIFILVLLSALFLGQRMLNVDGDLGRHLALGRYILSSGRVPTTDLFSFTRAGASRPPYEWLGQVLFALANRALGLDGVVLLVSCAIAGVSAVVYLDSLHRSRAPIIAALITLWAAEASSLHWLTRPHVFSFVFFAVWMLWLEGLRRGEDVTLWQFPILMLVWANTHGGFVFGFLSLGAYLAGWCIDALRATPDRKQLTEFLSIGGSSLVASVLTPNLWHNWDAVLSNRSVYVLSRTVETMPAQISSVSVWPFLGMLTLSLVLIALRFRRLPAGPVLTLLGLGAASMLIARNIPLYVIAAAPPMADWLASAVRDLRPWQALEMRVLELDAGLSRATWSVTALAFALAALVYLHLSQQHTLFDFSPERFPVGATAWLQQHPEPHRMYNDFNWGGYMLYRVWPAQKVFIDSQSDFYGEMLTRQAADINSGAPYWQAAFQEYRVDSMLVSQTSGLARSAASNPAWQIVYEDELAMILVRK